MTHLFAYQIAIYLLVIDRVSNNSSLGTEEGEYRHPGLISHSEISPNCVMFFFRNFDINTCPAELVYLVYFQPLEVVDRYLK